MIINIDMVIMLMLINNIINLYTLTTDIAGADLCGGDVAIAPPP